MSSNELELFSTRQHEKTSDEDCFKSFSSILNLCPSFRVLNPWNQYSNVPATLHFIEQESHNSSQNPEPDSANPSTIKPDSDAKSFLVRANAEGTFGKFLRSHGNVRALKKCFGRFFPLFRCLLFVIMLVRLFSVLSCLLN